MPRIFDNIDEGLLPALKNTLNVSQRADFCVGYFNLRGWKCVDQLIERWSGGPGQQCRLIVGMHKLPGEELKMLKGAVKVDDEISQNFLVRQKEKIAKEFRDQLMVGAPNDADEAGLRRLSTQLKAGKVTVKLYLRHTLHAKLYLCFRPDETNPRTGFLGSSNLTMSGLSRQGELNVDVLDHDMTQKLEKWFNDRWDDRCCIDITKELIKVIDESWARETPPTPYQLYVKMAYHLSEEARAGVTQFELPSDMQGVLLDYQSAAVRIASRHLDRRGGVILGDVVGLGKTMMATAIARIFQEPPYSYQTLVVCPKNLVKMWEVYFHKYRLMGMILPNTQLDKLDKLRRYQVVVIDESHNLRNRDGVRWQQIHDYIERNASKCIQLSATPYNKEYADIGSQLRLFLGPDVEVGARPEAYLATKCQGRLEEFTKMHQCKVNTLAAFEKSEQPDDWRELMRLYMVRRTRSFIEKNYSITDCSCGTAIHASLPACPKCNTAKDAKAKRYLKLGNGQKFHFPKRIPKNLAFEVNEKDPADQFGRLYAEEVVDIIRELNLPRYGLGLYVDEGAKKKSKEAEKEVLERLWKGGKRLIGFCKTNFFKRLESSGDAFLLSLRRHIAKNFVYMHAIENGLDLPIGSYQKGNGRRESDRDPEQEYDEETGISELNANTDEEFRLVGSSQYQALRAKKEKGVTWVRPGIFTPDLLSHLKEDTQKLVSILKLVGQWDPARDMKLAKLLELITKKHKDQKVLVFSQFADTVEYIGRQLAKAKVDSFAAVTGDDDDPSAFAKRFSPSSNKDEENPSSDLPASEELRVLIATDTLSEGQNLQDGHIVVNYDLPWAIIRLIQRAGRVDRIGQKAEEILCYSFIPAEGVEKLIRLRARVVDRLRENEEVVGSDEVFFEDSKTSGAKVKDLFTEKSGSLDDGEDEEVDLVSIAYQIWQNAYAKYPELKTIIPQMPNVVYTTKSLEDVAADKRPGATQPREGVLTYIRNTEGMDSLAWLDMDKKVVTESHLAILRAAACEPDCPTIDKHSAHHVIVEAAIVSGHRQGMSADGNLGGQSSTRRKLYDLLKAYAESMQGQLFDTAELKEVTAAVYERQLTERSRDKVAREIRAKAHPQKVVDLVLSLHQEDKLCVHADESEAREAQIICSMGIRKK
jgi:phosphatidylserine/phosphatidylglycerophosphate/cardiolipin synthase-like enzyme